MQSGLLSLFKQGHIKGTRDKFHLVKKCGEHMEEKLKKLKNVSERLY